jgi:hypothetical protein
LSAIPLVERNLRASARWPGQPINTISTGTVTIDQMALAQTNVRFRGQRGHQDELVSVQRPVGEHFMTKLFQFVPEMQHRAHEIMDHRVISRVKVQCFFNLVFENFLPPLKNGNMVWFRHGLHRNISNSTLPRTTH